jgi:LmbE family N-acetylglucosaminyl deacetylase
MLADRKIPKRILIISPHADDEVIGCGGMIALASKEGIEVTIIVMATGGVKHCHLHEKATTENRITELKASASSLGVSITKVLFPEKDMKLSTIPELEIVTMLDTVLNDNEYDECYIPEPNHNLDHRITYE